MISINVTLKNLIRKDKLKGGENNAISKTKTIQYPRLGGFAKGWGERSYYCCAERG